MASAGGFKSTDDFKRQRELDKARQAGIAPAALDENGKEINPHIPNYMTNAPWYLNKDQPTLTHQKNWREKKGDDSWYDRGVKVFQATKYRKGACEKCVRRTLRTSSPCRAPGKGAGSRPLRPFSLRVPPLGRRRRRSSSHARAPPSSSSPSPQSPQLRLHVARDARLPGAAARQGRQVHGQEYRGRRQNSDHRV